MKYQIVGKNITVTDGIRNAIIKKLSKMDNYFRNDEAIECRALVRSYRTGAKVEITIFTPNVDLRAEVVDVDLYNAVDLAVEKLAGQLRKLKTRMDRSNGKLSLGRSIVFDSFEAEKEANDKDEIVRTKQVYLEPMSLETAVMKMEALGHDFFVYLDIEDDLVSVLYKRIENGYGIIQVENKLSKK